MLHQIVEIDSKKVSSEQLPEELDCLVSRNSKRELWKNEYAVPTTAPDLKTQNDDYLDGRESSIPSDVMEKFKWLVDNGISFKAFRKVITDSCDNAAKATQEVFENCEDKYKQKVSLTEEVKQMVFQVQKNHSHGQVVISAINLPGDHHLVEGYESGKIDEGKYLEFLSELLNQRLTKVFPANKVHGRNDPPTFHLSEENVPGFPDVVKEHTFSDELFKNEKNFLNLGNGTFRIELSRIEFVKMFNIMRSQQTDKYIVNNVDGITQEEAKNSETRSRITEDKRIGCKVLELEANIVSH